VCRDTLVCSEVALGVPRKDKTLEKCAAVATTLRSTDLILGIKEHLYYLPDRLDSMLHIPMRCKYETVLRLFRIEKMHLHISLLSLSQDASVTFPVNM
jgi:hypothetical protein